MREVKTCRACLGSNLVEFFDMGDMPLANGLLPALSEQITPLKDWPDLVERGGDICKNIENGVKSINAWINEKRYPLKLNYCNDCGMVQLAHVVDANELYSDIYPFQTGSSRVMVEHYAKLFREFYPNNGLVLEIGGNDSSGWKAASDVHGNSTYYLNVDPCGGDIKELFTESLGKRLADSGNLRNLIVACNVLGHVDDLDDFLRGVKHLLHPDGVFVFEVPYWGRTCSEAAYSQIYSEHLSYFSYLPLQIALQRNGLEIFDTQGFEVHGGSVRVSCQNRRGVLSIYEKFPFDACQQFAERVEIKKNRLREKINRLVDAGKKVIGYCASAKGAVILNHCDIRTKWIEYVIDSTPAKQGRYMPGTHQMIVDAKWAMGQGVGDHDPPEAILLLSSNHAAEVKAKHPDYRGEWITAHG